MRPRQPQPPLRSGPRAARRPRSALTGLAIDADAPRSRERIGETTYRRVRADIVHGRLAPGQRLTLDRMREAYGTAVSTLRELLNRLASEGLIHAEGSRGFEVASISATNLREIADLRVLLECHALRSSFAKGDMEWEGRVVAAHHKLSAMEAKIANGERSIHEDWRRYDFEFHRALISACGSQVLLDAHAAAYDKYLRYLMIAAVFRGEAAASQHRALLRFALARDWALAQATVATHVEERVEQMQRSRLFG
jgi:DNA-binding GntR family transcriptional regulator